jgi:predicted  nucleic acid-binding Zn-ribbon protein
LGTYDEASEAYNRAALALSHLKKDLADLELKLIRTKNIASKAEKALKYCRSKAKVVQLETYTSIVRTIDKCKGLRQSIENQLYDVSHQQTEVTETLRVLGAQLERLKGTVIKYDFGRNSTKNQK